MASEYNPASIEKKWQAIWDGKEIFRTPAKAGRRRFYCLDFFPFPSASGLHVGHPLGYFATDILCRYKRMNGFTVLHPMGWDAFGLPAEQHALETGEHPAEITKRNCAAFKEQMQRLGLSYDWSREIATSDPSYYRWTQWIFLKLYGSWFDEKQGKARPIADLPIPSSVEAKGSAAVEEYRSRFRLAYIADAMVNWCPELCTVLANEEVINGKSERGNHDVVKKPMRQWHLRITKYAERLLEDLDGIDWPDSIKEQQRNWIGRKQGVEIDFRIAEKDSLLTVFTTRPDTLFGATYCAISPEHPLVSELTHPEAADKVRKYCEDAAKMSDLARSIENRKKSGVFTGSFAINPISGEHLPIFVGDYVLMSIGRGAIMGVPAHDERDFDFARTYQLDIRPVFLPEEESAEVVIAVAEGEMAWSGTGRMVPYKTKVFRDLGLEGRTCEMAAARIIKWLEENECGRRVTTYKLRDWLFSRQRYWGEPIPIVHWPDGTTSAVPENELPLLLPAVPDYRAHEGGESPLARAEEWLNVVDEETGTVGRRETNTMPNWAGSCWYYLRFIDPHNEERFCDPALEKQWMPVDLYVGGAEHAVLHLLYSRFWHKVLYDLGYVSTKEPFGKLFNQGMLQTVAFKDRRGAIVPVEEVDLSNESSPRHKTSNEPLERITAKMSKSLKNVVTPDEIVSEYGADTLRVYEMFMGPLDSARIWDQRAISGSHRFLKRSFSLVSSESGSRSKDDPGVRRSLARMLKRVTESIEQLKLNTAISSMMEFINEVEGKRCSRDTLRTFVTALSPFAPHLAEELWESLGEKECVALAKWPALDESLLEDETLVVVIQVNGKKRKTIEVPRAIGEKELKKAVYAAMEEDGSAPPKDAKMITVYQTGTKLPKLVNLVVETD